MTSLTGASCQNQPDRDVVYQFRFKADPIPGKKNAFIIQYCGFWDVKNGKTMHYVSCANAEKTMFGENEQTLRDALEYKKQCDAVLNP